MEKSFGREFKAFNMINISKPIEDTCAIVIAVVLWVAALSHISNPYFFFERVIAYELPVPPILAKLATVIVPFLEFGLASSVVVSSHRRLIFSMTLLLFVLFAIVQVQALIRGLVIDCGCFGGLAKREVGGVSLSIAAGLALLSLIGFYFTPHRIETGVCA